ncbi:MAG TPA: NADPH-dependent F420 reductase [Candidatus Sulfobium mesophilum]|nr:NADPH-dependent F420 reductase [Candidatus Sulfobium mesophilum]
MNIGIIGSGNMGSGLGRLWAAKGHNIFFSFSRDMNKLARLAESTPNSKAVSPAEAVESADVVLISVGYGMIKEALAETGLIQNKIIIDCTNPVKADLSGLSIGLTTSAAEEIARLVPQSRVVKAFNTVFAEIYHSENRLFGSRMSTMLYCGDDGDSKSVVSQLIRETGFEPIDAGPLKSARYLESLAMLMIQLGRVQGMGANIALSLIRR